jgi:hypothetical protein
MVGAPAGPGGCTGIAVGYGATDCRIYGCHISDFYTGVSIGGDHADDTWITNCKIDAAVALSIVVPSGGGKIYGVYASECTLAMLENYIASPATSGVLISQGTGSVASIVITGCIVYGFYNAGIEIDSGQNVVVVGGQYSSNGQNPSQSYLGAGIAVAGGQQVTISGADCSGINQFWQTKISGAVKQPYGIAVSGVASDVTITGCQLPYNKTSGLLVAQVGDAPPDYVYIRDCNAAHYSSYSVAMNIVSSAVNVQITNCPGYNDRNAELNGAVAPTSALSAAECTTAYYGPSLVIFTNPSGGGWAPIDVHIRYGVQGQAVA